MLQAEESAGMPVVFSLVDAAKTWITLNVSEPTEDDSLKTDSEVSTQGFPSGIWKTWKVEKALGTLFSCGNIESLFLLFSGANVFLPSSANKTFDLLFHPDC